MTSRSEIALAHIASSCVLARINPEGCLVGAYNCITGQKDFDGEPNAVHIEITYFGLRDNGVRTIMDYGRNLLAREIPATLGGLRTFEVSPEEGACHTMKATLAAGKAPNAVDDLMAAAQRVYDRMCEGDFGQPTALGRICQKFWQSLAPS